MCFSELMPGVYGFSQSAFDPQAGVTGSCALSDVGIGNQTQVKRTQTGRTGISPQLLGKLRQRGCKFKSFP